ncbi:MAG: DNA replication and repair protein RecF [Bacteroidetes bacterium]|nr:DNA replication and repair protein RecF [Bacteroidota bacterium]MBU2508589.1 DNA replication and repair protein RecF [Bacteroidota bacterium]
MVIDSIKLKNFRLHRNSELNFSRELNYIVGGNGQGKTTILEAIYYLCTTKSFNRSHDSEGITFDTDFFDVSGLFKDFTDNKVRCSYDRETNRKQFFLNDKQIHRSSSIIGKFPVVILSQADHSITLGAPADRRKFVDSVISQASETYLSILLEYNKTLRQRSSLLTRLKEYKSKNLLDQLDSWSELLIRNGVEIVKHRLRFTNEFNNYLNSSYTRLLNGTEIPKINYDFLGTNGPDKIEERFIEELSSLRESELIRAANLVGPHRDDFYFYVNDYELKKYGSQGQHKTFQIALRFAQFYFLKETTGKTPIFLMDDIYGDLDNYRAVKTGEYLKEVGQAFLTMTDFAKYENLNKSGSDKLIYVNKGDVSYA